MTRKIKVGMYVQWDTIWTEKERRKRSMRLQCRGILKKSSKWLQPGRTPCCSILLRRNDAGTWEAETEGSQVQGLPGLQDEVKARLGNLERFCFRIKKWEEDSGHSSTGECLPGTHQAPDSVSAVASTFRTFIPRVWFESGGKIYKTPLPFWIFCEVGSWDNGLTTVNHEWLPGGGYTCNDLYRVS